MCGIVALCYPCEHPGLGLVASDLLRRLEYRGYDATGGAFFREDGSIRLLKKVGAPSRVVVELDMEGQAGQRFIGQVRWATYGAVTDLNSQPHHVQCRVNMAGAHNGNISNTDTLKTYLRDRGHQVLSDNDGEMITHLVEDFYAANLADPAGALGAFRQAYAEAGLPVAVPEGAFLLMDAARRANAMAVGSYAAAFADPKVPGVVAVKAGSSLYAGLGRDEAGAFVVVSSDLTSVLSRTRMLIPLAEGEGIWFTDKDYVIFSLAGAPTFAAPHLRRSKLNVRDTALRAPFSHFMAQEIASAPDNLEALLRYYFSAGETEGLFGVFQAQAGLGRDVLAKLLALSDLPDGPELQEGLRELLRHPACLELVERTRPFSALFSRREAPASDERQLLEDLAAQAPDARETLAMFDLLLIWKKQSKVTGFLRDIIQVIRTAQAAGGHIYLVASGTSYHAALVAGNFFNNLAGVQVYPSNPGQFRSTWMAGLSSKDVLIGITQSGETKDLIDIYQEVQERYPQVRRISIVNNENSRIPQELSEFYLPILCGPEIAVAATKSFINQVAVLYLLAGSFALEPEALKGQLLRARALIQETLDTCEAGIEDVAQRLFLEPSLHILGTGLIGLAREGALKIREVVLNHAEGYDAAEFKHGPNTILGKNTLFSIGNLAELLEAYEAGRTSPFLGGLETLRARPELVEGLFSNYPLIFICSSDERDTRITVTQMHTHKIRGADLVLIAERDADLAQAVGGRPSGHDRYWSKYLEVPACGDPNLFVFGAAVVLQRLAFRLSALKMAYLDALGVVDHGVDPDTPKNVSKSITVD